MVKLTRTINRFGNSKVMVIGDFVLDTYTIGKARRISPEAPVAVVQVSKEEHRPGMAGNVILNLISMGSEVVAVGRVGSDYAGESLLDALKSEKVDTRGIFVQQGFSTPVKNRIIAENQQIVRVDYEQNAPIPELLEQHVIEILPELLKGVAVIAISDYGKGFLSRTLLGSIIDHAKQIGIPVIADPKGIDFSKYQGATIIKPNLSEAYAAANLPHETPLEYAAARVLEISQAEVLMVTRAEAGISLFYKNGDRQDFPVAVREVKDVTGAGDTVLAMLTCATAHGLPIDEAAQLSNIAAGIAIERFGCARVTLSEVARCLLDQNVVSKVFDEEHLFALQEALKARCYTVLGVSATQSFTPLLFTAIKRFGHTLNRDLLIYFYDSPAKEDFVNVLASLHDVNFIIDREECLKILCEKTPPQQTYAIVGEEIQLLAGHQDLLKPIKKSIENSTASR